MVAWCARWGAQEERAGGAVLQTLGTARARRRGHVCTVYGWGGVVLGLQGVEGIVCRMRRETKDPRNRAPSIAHLPLLDRHTRTLARCVPVKTRSSSDIRVANGRVFGFEVLSG